MSQESCHYEPLCLILSPAAKKTIQTLWQHYREQEERAAEHHRLVAEHLTPLLTSEESALTMAKLLPPGSWRFSALCAAETFAKKRWRPTTQTG